MALPLHTFEPTGDPCVDAENYFRDPAYHPRVALKDWFSRNHHVLAYEPSEIVKDAVKFLDVTRAPYDHGIYFLVQDDEIVYVGKARCIYERLEGHYWRSGKKFDRYWCFGGVPYEWLTHAEGYYIKRCKPVMNIATVPYNPALDKISKLQRRF